MANSVIHTVMMLMDRPKQLGRYMQSLIDKGQVEECQIANNFLAVQYWHRNDLNKAMSTFKQTIHWGAYSVEAVWAMRLLSVLYQRLGLKSERNQMDMRRLMTLRRMLHTSDQDEQIEFAYAELRREYDERDLLSEFSNYYRRVA